jgi:uncharacterized protein YgiM (DUF1202 family)
MRTHILTATGLLAGGLFATVGAQAPARVSAAGDRLTIRSCADASCRVVAELPKGQSVEVLKTENGWHRVLVTMQGARATTGWVEITQTAAAVRGAVAYGGPTGERQSMPSRAGSETTPAPPAPAECLTCVATRTATAAEWSAALAAAADMKTPRFVNPPSGVASPSDPGSRSTTASSRAETVRRDGRTSMERMRDEIDERYGRELKQLGEVAAKTDANLRTYMTACYERFQSIPVLPPGPTPPGGNPPPVRPLASIFDLWRGRPAFAWNESWSSRAAISAESTTFCQGLWNDVSGQSADVQAAVARIEAAARDSDIFPGVVRDALLAYGLSDGK